MKQILILLTFLMGMSAVADAQIFKPRNRTVTTPYMLVDNLPDSIAYGQQVLFNGTMWRGLVEGESSLPAGTPWPVKGYEELTITVSSPEAGPSLVLMEHVNDGAYTLLLSGESATGYVVEGIDEELILKSATAFDRASAIPLTIGAYYDALTPAFVVVYDESLDYEFGLVTTLTFVRYPPPPTP